MNTGPPHWRSLFGMSHSGLLWLSALHSCVYYLADIYYSRLDDNSTIHYYQCSCISPPRPLHVPLCKSLVPSLVTQTPPRFHDMKWVSWFLILYQSFSFFKYFSILKVLISFLRISFSSFKSFIIPFVVYCLFSL